MSYVTDDAAREAAKVLARLAKFLNGETKLVRDLSGRHEEYYFKGS